MLASGGLRVADEAVGPEIGDVDLKDVLAWVERRRDVGGVGLLPKDFGGFSVDAEGGDFVDFAKVEQEGLGWVELGGGEADGGAIGGGAGEVADAGVVEVGPGFEQGGR